MDDDSMDDDSGDEDAPPPAKEAELWIRAEEAAADGRIYYCLDDETPEVVAKKLGIEASVIVSMNSQQLPGIQTDSFLQEGAKLEVPIQVPEELNNDPETLADMVRGTCNEFSCKKPLTIGNNRWFHIPGDFVDLCGECYTAVYKEKDTRSRYLTDMKAQEFQVVNEVTDLGKKLKEYVCDASCAECDVGLGAFYDSGGIEGGFRRPAWYHKIPDGHADDSIAEFMLAASNCHISKTFYADDDTYDLCQEHYDKLQATYP